MEEGFEERQEAPTSRKLWEQWSAIQVERSSANCSYNLTGAHHILLGRPLVVCLNREMKLLHHV